MEMSFNLLVLDSETTGVKVEEDRILSFALKTSDGLTRTWIINPGVEVPEEASEVHGMTTEWIQEHGDPNAEGVISQILEVVRSHVEMGFTIGGFNHSFDLAILYHEAVRHGLEPLDPERIISVDPLILDRRIDKYRKGKRTLMDVARVNGIEIEEDKLHDALYDVEVTEKLLPILLNKTYRVEKDLHGLSREEILVKLQGLQANWKKSWAQGLTEYFRKKGQTEEDGSEIIVSGAFPW